MNYNEAVSYIEGIGKFAIREPLKHAMALLARFDNPQNSLKVVHTAGTNGKGSVCAYLDSMFRAGGYRCGLFTSPHLVKINERFRINGEMISDEDFLKYFLMIKDVLEDFMAEGWEHPSYFEILCVMAMLYYRDQKVDYVILETGLGGKLDATNTVAKPLASVITSISLDHTEILGDTIEKIAGEKAGIIKAGVPVIFDASLAAVAGVIEKRAKELGSPCYGLTPERCKILENTPEGIRFSFSGESGEEQLSIPFVAAYQMMNASLAYFTMKILKDEHGISDEHLKMGIANTHWEGRMETILPGVIVDGAHNEDGVRRFIETAVHFKKNYRISILFSAVADKKHEKMIQTICEEIQPDAVVATQIWGERIVPAAQLADEFRRYGAENVLVEEDIHQAFSKALEIRGDGMLFCVGSLYLVGEIKRCM